MIKLLYQIIIGLLLNALSVYSIANTNNTNDYADNLNKSCSYAKEHLKYIEERTKTLVNKSGSKQELTEPLKVLVQKWEEIRINNECFTVGTQRTPCHENKYKELLLASSLINLTVTLIKDIESDKNTSVISKNLQKSQVTTQDVINGLCK
jgi:hypothetical protein